MIVVLDEDASARDALAGMLRDMFPRARVIGARLDDAAGVAGRDAATPAVTDTTPVVTDTTPVVTDTTLVVTGLAAVARVRPRLPAGARVIALTREMGPDTLLRAEALGVAAAMRAPATSRGLQAVVESMLGRDGPRNPD